MVQRESAMAPLIDGPTDKLELLEGKPAQRSRSRVANTTPLGGQAMR